MSWIPLAWAIFQEFEFGCRSTSGLRRTADDRRMIASAIYSCFCRTACLNKPNPKYLGPVTQMPTPTLSLFTSVVTIITAPLAIVSVFWAYKTLKDGAAQMKLMKDMLLKTEALVESATQTAEASSKQMRLAEANLERAQEISNALTTKFDGIFPNYLPHLAQLIAQSQRFVRILGPVAPHGAYSQPDLWERIHIAIRQKVNEQHDRKLKPSEPPYQAILVYSDEENRLKNYRRQYENLKDEARWTNWKKDNRDLLCRYLSDDLVPEIENMTLDGFLRFRCQRDADEIKHTFKNFICCPGSEVYAFFCWITDAGAIFSFKTEDQEGHYHGSAIFTKDPHLLQALDATFTACMKRTKIGRDLQLRH